MCNEDQNYRVIGILPLIAHDGIWDYISGEILCSFSLRYEHNHVGIKHVLSRNTLIDFTRYKAE